MSKDSILCMIAEANENEYNVAADIGDMIMEQSSGGNSTYALLCSTAEKKDRQKETVSCIILSRI